MRFTSDSLQKVKLVMFEKTMMKDSEMKEVDGKKVFVKNGQETEFTTYTFRDSFGEKLVILSKENSYRALEGETVDIEVEIVYNEFGRKNRVSLASVKKSAAALV